MTPHEGCESVFDGNLGVIRALACFLFPVGIIVIPAGSALSFVFIAVVALIILSALFV